MIDIETVYEDDHILAINKPDGVLVHGSGRGETDTVVDWFLKHYPESAGVGEEDIETNNGGIIKRPGIVHRLDRDTSGVMLVAKTTEGHTHLKSQFQDRSIKKTYLAWVYGVLKNDSGTIEAPIGRSKTFAKWTAIPKALRGNIREAITHWNVLERRENHTLVEVEIETGRTHQIRVHMQYLNYPVVADSLYAGKKHDPNNVDANMGFTRQALHAQLITFTNLDGKEITTTAPKPSDFLTA